MLIIITYYLYLYYLFIELYLSSIHCILSLKLLV